MSTAICDFFIFLISIYNIIYSQSNCHKEKPIKKQNNNSFVHFYSVYTFYTIRTYETRAD